MPNDEDLAPSEKVGVERMCAGAEHRKRSRIGQHQQGRDSIDEEEWSRRGSPARGEDRRS